MKTREDYEKICDRTFTLAGDAQGARVQIDLLLDIRELLIWLKEDILYRRVVEERVKATKDRISSIIKEDNALDMT